MKIAYASDLHLEFGKLEVDLPDADVLVLAGDICVASDIERAYFKRVVEFFEEITYNYKHVIYVMGNHEHYHGDFAKTYDLLKSTLKFDNLHILENGFVDIEDFRFIGTTLWTDLNKSDGLTEFHVSKNMNDYAVIVNSGRKVTFSSVVDGKKQFHERDAKLSTSDTYNAHKIALEYINQVLTKDKKCVIVTHHAPSYASIHPSYVNDKLMTGAYMSDLSEFILDSEIKLWIHGHIHWYHDYMIGNTRVVCNPRGYDGHESVSDCFNFEVIEL